MSDDTMRVAYHTRGAGKMNFGVRQMILQAIEQCKSKIVVVFIDHDYERALQKCKEQRDKECSLSTHADSVLFARIANYNKEIDDILNR